MGKATEKKLKVYGIHKIQHLQECGKEQLIRLFGEKQGEHLYRLAFGIDERVVETESEEKSISHEETFGKDITDNVILRNTLIHLVEKVGMRLRALDRVCRTVFIKIRFQDFTTITRQMSWDEGTDLEKKLINACLQLWEKENVKSPVRLIGFGVSNLADKSHKNCEKDLFSFSIDKNETANLTKKNDSKLDEAMDQLRRKFGQDVIHRGFIDKNKN